MNKYDSTADTLKHIRRVNDYLIDASCELLSRAKKHDQSKLEEPEKSSFDEVTLNLNTLKFGSEEYRESTRSIKPAIDHHYSVNSHHPQHYENGINGMNLFDIVEMFFDWKASGERTKDGNIMTSIAINSERFGISKQLRKILENTAMYFFENKNIVRELTYKERYDMWFSNNYETGMEKNYDVVPDFENEYYDKTPTKIITEIVDGKLIEKYI